MDQYYALAQEIKKLFPNATEIEILTNKEDREKFRKEVLDFVETSQLPYIHFPEELAREDITVTKIQIPNGLTIKLKQPL